MKNCDNCALEFDYNNHTCFFCTDKNNTVSNFKERKNDLDLENLFEGAPIIVKTINVTGATNEYRRYYVKSKTFSSNGKTTWSDPLSYSTIINSANIRLPDITESPKNTWLACHIDFPLQLVGKTVLLWQKQGNAKITKPIYITHLFDKEWYKFQRFMILNLDE